MSTIEAYTTKAGKRYAVRYRQPDGKQTMKRGFVRKVDAQRWDAENTVAMTRGAYVAPAAGRLSFGAAAGDWISTRHDLAPSTLARYRGIVEQINTRFGALPLSKMTRPLLREWIAELVDAETPAETVHKTVGVVRQILQHAVDDQRLAANPADKLALPPIRPTEMRFLTLDQLRQLAAAAGDNAAAIWVLGICGLRMGELVGLQHQDVDRAAGVLHIVRSVTLVDSKLVEGPPKNRKRRTVPLPAYIADQLDEGAQGEPVFPAPAGGMIRHTNWRRRVFDPAVDAAGLAPLHPHELRHSAASLAIGAGANIKAVQAMLGHARASITLDRYGHLYPSDVEQITSTLNGMLALHPVSTDCAQNVLTDEKNRYREISR